MVAPARPERTSDGADKPIIIFILAVGTLAITSLVGLAVLAFLRPGHQRLLLPAVPLVGLAVLVAALHWTGLVLGARWGMWIVVALAAAAVIVQGLRGRLSIPDLRAGLPGLTITLAIGLVGALLVWLPLLRAGDAVFVQSANSYDAFYYVSTTHWLMDHSFLSLPRMAMAPVLGTPAPVYGPAATSITIGLRLGQEMVQGGLSAVLGVSPAAGFLSWIGVWVMLMPGAVWVLGDALGVRRWFRALLGFALVVSLSVIGQALASNADSLLGIAFVPLVIALFWLTLSRGAGRVPLVLAALGLAALVGTYTEYGPFMLPVLAGVGLVGPRAGYARRLGRFAAIVGVALILNPVIWWRALLSLTVTGGVASTQTAPAGVVPRLMQLLGPFERAVASWDEGPGSLLQAAAIGVILVGLLAGIVLGLRWLDTRGLSAGALVATAIAAYLALRGNSYVTFRISGMMLPLLLVAAGVGWSRLLPAFAERPRPRWRVVGAVAGVVVIAAFAALNARAVVAATHRVTAQFTVGPEFAQAAEWVDRYGGPGGRDISVATASLFDQLWLSDELADDSQVSYISLRGDLGYRGSAHGPSYWNGELDRYLLVGPGAFFSAPGSAVVQRNDRFTLVDMRAAQGRALVAVPVQRKGTLYWFVDDRGGVAGMDGSSVLLLSGADTGAGRSLTFWDGHRGDQVALTQDGNALEKAVVAPGGRAALPLASTRFRNGVADVDIDVSGKGPLSLSGVAPTR